MLLYWLLLNDYYNKFLSFVMIIISNVNWRKILINNNYTKLLITLTLNM